MGHSVLHPSSACPIPLPGSTRAAERLPGLLGCLNSVFVMVPQGLQSEVAESHNQRRLLPPRSELQQHFSWRQNSSLKRKCRDSSFKCSTGLSRSFAAIHKALNVKDAETSPAKSQWCLAGLLPAAREHKVSCGGRQDTGISSFHTFLHYVFIFFTVFFTFFTCSQSLRVKAHTSFCSPPCTRGYGETQSKEIMAGYLPLGEMPHWRNINQILIRRIPN